MKPSQASSTAKLIAASTLLLASDPRTAALVAPRASPLCAQLLSGSRADRLLAASASFAPTRMLWRLLERMVQPGIAAHYWHRKRWIEHRCRASIAKGLQRVVVVGAGFDTLALRLAPEFAHVEWIELDHPATQRAKCRALDGSPLPPNLRFTPADLAAEPLPAECLGGGRSTLLIAEGLLMYLPLAAIDRLFRTLAMPRAAPMHMVFSFMSKWPDGSTGFRPRSGWVERWLAWRDEPFTWSIEPVRIDAFLRDRGLRALQVATAQALAVEAGSPGARLAGENLVLCEATQHPLSQHGLHHMQAAKACPAP